MTEDPNIRSHCTTCPRLSDLPVCDSCRADTLTHLDQFPTLLDRLVVALAATPTGLGEYVSGGAFGTRPPLATSALTLVATTAEAIRTAITLPLPGQDGSIPLFVVGWAGWWRLVQSHHQPVGVRLQSHHPQVRAAQLVAEVDGYRRVSAILGLDPARELLQTSDPAVVSTVEVTDWVTKEIMVRADPVVETHWRRLPTPDDPLEERWTARFGARHLARRVASDLTYLRTWVPNLWDAEDMPGFVTGLRKLFGTARAVLGEQPAEQRLGRCPVPRWDRAANAQMVRVEVDPVSGERKEVPVYCGQMLVRQADVSRVVCSRCRSEWGDLGLWTLAARMRDVWGASAGRDAWRD